MKIDKRIKWLIVISIMLIVLSLNTNDVMAAGEIELTLVKEMPNEYTRITTVPHGRNIEAWHYSGGYWRGSALVRDVWDNELDGDITKLEELGLDPKGYEVTIHFPNVVKNAIAEGKKVYLQLETEDDRLELADIIKYSEDVDGFKMKYDTNTLTITFHPKFNFYNEEGIIEGYRDKGVNITTIIPFLDALHGSNGFSLFRPNGTSMGAWATYTRHGQSFAEKKISPDMILEDGKIKPGYDILTTLGDYKSEDMRIGQTQAVFKSGGAFGLVFGYRFNFNFYVDDGFDMDDGEPPGEVAPPVPPVGGGSGVDIGVVGPIKLFRYDPVLKKDVEQKFLTQTSLQHKVEINVKHLLGDETVGLHPVDNPKVMVDVYVIDANNNTILTQTIQATSNLEKGKIITLPKTNNFTGASGKVRVCAKINDIHTVKGYNLDTSNDLLCADFYMVKNYAITDLRVTPAVEYIPQGQTSYSTPLSFNFGIVNESAPETGVLSESPRVVIKRGGTTVWQGNLPAAIGKTTMHAVTIPMNAYGVGEATFTVEVNPDKTVTEFKPGVANPYADNVRSVKYRVAVSPNCIDCNEKRITNTWTERFTGTELKGYVDSFQTYVSWPIYDTVPTVVCLEEHPITKVCTWQYSYYPIIGYDGTWVPYSYCVTTSYNGNLWPDPIPFTETYQVSRVWFRSKWSEDSYGGWVDLKTGITGKVAVGLGFDLRIETNYSTNRVSNMPGPAPYTANHYSNYYWRVGNYGPSGHCSYATRSPGVSPIDHPNVVYLEMPFGKSGQYLCYILNRTGQSGSWTNSTKEFMVPKENSSSLRAVNVGSDRPGIGTHTLRITTPQFLGYQPDAPVNTVNKKLLQDCIEVLIQVIPQSEINSHIVQ